MFMFLFDEWFGLWFCSRFSTPAVVVLTCVRKKAEVKVQIANGKVNLREVKVKKKKVGVKVEQIICVCMYMLL